MPWFRANEFVDCRSWLLPHFATLKMAEKKASGYTSKYSTYKKLTTSTEVSYASNTTQSSFKKESATDYLSSRGMKSSTREFISVITFT